MKNRFTIKVIAAYALLASANAAFSQHSGLGHDTPAPTAGKVAPSPYAGERNRTIKSLSDSDAQALRAGAGMAYAKAAELNGYPGPAHVLELATPLSLTSDQRAATEKLKAEHTSKASALGAQLIEAERALDTAFAMRQVDAGRIAELTQAIGWLQATLRAEHLQTHLAQNALLSSRQIALYQTLRGYDKPSMPTSAFSH